MAGRVNTKFVVLLIIVLVVAAGGVAAAWWVTAKTDASEYIARGDSFYRQGNFERAAEQYGRALKNKNEINNVELILSYADSLSRFQVADTKRSRSLIDQMRNWWGRALNVDPTNEKALSRLMDMYITLGREMNDFRAWERMYKRSTSLLGSQPDHVLARKYRIIAQVERMNSLDLPQIEREAIRKDIDFVRKALPDDLEIIYADAKWHLAEADRIAKTGARFDHVETHRITAINMLRQTVAEHPGNPEPLIQLTRTLQRADEENDARQTLVQLEADMDHYLDKPHTVIGVIELLVQLYPKLIDNPNAGLNTHWSQGMARALTLIAKAVEAQPNSLQLKLAYGRMLRINNQTEKAYEIFDDIRQTTYKTNAMQAMMISQYRYVAAEQSATLLLLQAQNKSRDDRQKLLTRVDDLIKELKDTSGDSAIVNLLSGRLAMERGQWAEAIEKLETASTQFGGNHLQTLLLASEAHRKMGTSGAAAERLIKVIKSQPNFIAGRLRLVEIYIGTRQLDLAHEQLQAALNQEPGNSIARQLKVQLLVAEKKFDQAINLLESIRAMNDPALAQVLIKVYYKAGRKDDALALAGARFEADPTNTTALQMVLQLDPDHREIYLNRAKEAGATDQVLTLMASQFDTNVDTLALLSEQIDKTSQSPIEKHLNKYRLLMGNNRPEDAEQELVAAEAIDSNHSLIVQIRFEEALQKKDFKTARALAQIASKQNLDRVQGLVYRGRLELAERRISLAVTNLKRASKINPLDATIWRVLGDALMAQSDFPTAREAYLEALRLKPDTAAVHRGLAFALNALEDFTSALQHFKQASDYAPNNLGLLNTYLAYERKHGDAMKVVEYRRKIAQEQPDNLGNRRTLAVLLADVDKPDEAQKILDTIIAEEGINRSNVLTQAQIKRASDDFEGTRQTLIDYVQSLGDKAESIDWLMAGRFLQQLGDVETALDYYRESRKVEDPKIQEGTRQLADALFSLKRFDQAAELYRKLLEKNETDIRVGLRLAEALLRQNKIDESETALNQIMAGQFDNTNSLMLRGMIARTRNRYQDALGHFDKAAEMMPNNARVYFERALAMLGTPGQEPQAIVQLNRAININPKMVQARLKLIELHTTRQDLSQATAEARKLHEQLPDYLPVRHLLVRLYIANNRLSSLRELLRESQKRFPEDPAWLEYQVQLDFENDDIDSAIANQKKLVGLKPMPITILSLVQMQLSDAKNNDALAVLQAHDDQVRTEPLLLAIRGRTQVALNNAGLARSDFQLALERCENINQILSVVNQMRQAWGKDHLLAELSNIELPAQANWIELAQAQFEANQQLYSAAISRLENFTFIQGSPEQLMADRLKALSYYQQQLFEPSRSAYERILAVAPNDVPTLNNLAYLLCESLNQPEQALPLAERAVSLMTSQQADTDTPGIGQSQLLDTLGWIFYRLNRLEEAEKMLRSSLAIDPLAPTSYHLAEVLAKNGQFLESKTLLNQAVDLAKIANDKLILDLATQRMAELETQN